MKNPQTLAEKLYNQFPSAKLKSIKDYSCCALTFMWCIGYDPEDTEAIIVVGQMIDKGIIDPDCTVYWDKVSRFISGRGCSIEKVNINSISKIKERTPVKYEYKNKSNGKTYSHWVGVQNGRVAFNPLETSQCVIQGHPVEMRKLTFIGGEK